MKTVWCLFDDGEGSYSKTIAKYFPGEFNIISFGLKNADVKIDLSDYGELFGKTTMFDTLNSLPKPDIILASPPCESWSNANAMMNGNFKWYKGNEVYERNDFTIRTKKQFNSQNSTFKPNWNKNCYSRINGELCAINTMRIIERYKPEIWVIENPQTSMIWRYYKQVQGFNGFENIAHYAAYDENFSKKPTCFYSNVMFNLRKMKGKAKRNMIFKRGRHNDYSRNYDIRSRIPGELVKDIIEQLEVIL
jgi:site-specific DNA-cytosine methylase